MNEFEKAIVSKLKDDNEYYNGIGKNYLSNSDISTLLNNPKQFRTPRPDNKNFVYGRYFHQLILEPEKSVEFPICDSASRNTKVYKEFIAEKNIEVALLQKEADEVIELKSIITNNMDFNMEITSAISYETPMIREIGGVLWKGKADIITANNVIDIKTTSNLDAFGYNAKWKYYYCSQAYIYQQLFGKPLVFLVIEKTTGQLGWFDCGKEFLELGKTYVEEAIDVYNTYYGNNPTNNIDTYYIKKTL
tara:strand:+ start:3575 stop:4318 length:744 start_codon:yes stop_codon:yes gene_type:complete